MPVQPDVNAAACGFCLEEPVVYRYQTIPIEITTPDGDVIRDSAQDWNVCQACAEFVEARRWDELTERVYQARAAVIPPDSRERVHGAARQAVDLFASAALAPRRPLIDLGGGAAPLPTPGDAAAFAAALSAEDDEDDEDDEDSPEVADWDWIEEQIERAKAAGELEADWIVESDLSFTGEFFFALAMYRLNGQEGEVRALAYHEFWGGWSIFFDLHEPDQQESELGPREILAVLRLAEAKVREAGGTFVALAEDEG